MKCSSYSHECELLLTHNVCFISDYSLRNGLLIFFLLVLPLLVVLVLVLLYVFRRDTLDPCLKGSLGRQLK